MSTPNEAIIYGYAINQLHTTKAGAAALEANAQVESSWDPTSLNAREGAIGLFQWEGGRRLALQRYAAAHGGKETDLAMQLGYLGQELTGPYRKVLSFLQTTNDPAAAAAYVDVGPGGRGSGTGFENSSGDATLIRQGDAQTIYGQIQHGQLTAKKAPPGTPLVPGGGRGVSDSVLNDVTSSVADTTSSVVDTIGSLFDFTWVVQLVLKSSFTIGGLSLVALGLYAAAQPIRDKAAPIAKAAAAA